jgi:ribosome-associated protein
MDTDYKSRTQKKNEAKALQRLGEQLVALPFSQLETMELPDKLLTAIESARKIKSHGARRRQIQYIGALMRHIDPQPIETALDASGRETSGNNPAPAGNAQF